MHSVKLRRYLSLIILYAIMLPGCASFKLQDCPERILGNDHHDQVRIRSSRVRMILASPSLVAARVAPYAAMAAYAYHEDKYCGNDTLKISPDDEQQLRQIIGQQWQRVPELELKALRPDTNGCEDPSGLYYHVWKRETVSSIDVAVVFRGTWGWKDWTNGNLHWFSKYVLGNDQYREAARYSERIIAGIRQRYAGTDRNITFYAVGHSLGGGLAQHVLYNRPHDYLQAFTFDPSPVTGYKDQSIENQIEGCRCDYPELGNEARIYRIYESYEILSNFRIFHKFFFGTERHIQELRFNFVDRKLTIESHGMLALALNLVEMAGDAEFKEGMNWLAGAEPACTQLFKEQLRKECFEVPADVYNRCP